MRRVVSARVLGVAAAAVVIGAAAIAALGLGGLGGSGDPTPSPRAIATTPVKLETLAVSVTVDAEISFGEVLPLQSAAAGTITWLPQAGGTVNRGEALLRANEQPVVLLFGPLPMFRPLTAGLRGTDVAQFETNLQALGFSGFPVDQMFTDATGRAVKRWQKSLGLAETGTVEIGQIIYAPGAMRIAEHRARVGASASGVILGATSTTKVVVAKVPVPNAGWAKTGTKVTVLVPNGQTTEATVASVAAEATPAQQEPAAGAPSEPVVQVTFTVSDQNAIAAFDKSPVKVRYVAQELPNVLTVPVVALLALAEGGYGLEIVDGSTTRVIAVQVGAFSEGRVEVRAEGLKAGMQVVVPS